MKDQLREIFGISVQEEMISSPGGLPLYMINGRNFRCMSIGGISFLLVVLPDNERFGVVALEKQLAKYMDVLKMPAAFSFHAINKKQRDALMERQIPFICLPFQCYLPFLGIALSNEFPNRKIIKTEKMAPSTQVLFLYFLYQAGDRSVIKKQAAEDLHMTRMSVTRASEQLLAMNLITQEPHGKELEMKAISTGRPFYELGEPFLINPVQRIITTRQSEEITDLPSAGEAALSQHSMLNETRVPVVACDKGNEILKTLPVLDEQWEPDENLVRIECWKYNPVLFSVNGTVDPVSLAASLKDHPDERVRGELTEYLEEVRW